MELACRGIKMIHNGVRRFGKVLLNNTRSYGNKRPAVILGIETSCDDTGCAVVDSDGNVLGEALNSQQQTHLNYGGIVPPIAQAMHRENITEVCEKAMRSANVRLRDIDAVAATVKPGLELSLLIGTNFGKYLSKVGRKPFIPIHHMEAHALTARMVEKVDFPFLVLLISGGHCLLAVAKDVATFYMLGQTIDNAPGESFDKVARRLKLRNLPDFSCLNGGAAIELAASRATDPMQFAFDLPIAHYRDCNFSFSGLQNKIIRYAIRLERDHDIKGDGLVPDINNLCAGFQMAAAKHLAHRTRRAMQFCITKDVIPYENQTLVVSGGVACNNFIAKALQVVCDEMDWRMVRPPPNLCTDNGVMIAWNGVERWIADEGVLRDPAKIEEVDVENRAPFGEDWTSKVVDEKIGCRTIKTKQLYDSSETLKKMSYMYINNYENNS